MADRRINELLRLINQQIEYKETLNEYLLKAVALSRITLSDNFLSYPQLIIHSYLWALNEFVEHCEQLNQEALNHLLREISFKV